MPALLQQASVNIEATTSIPDDVLAPLRPHIAGGQAELHRYAAPAEKAGIFLGAYNPSSNEEYNWPDLSAGGLVDLDYVKLFIDEALLQYYQHLTTSSDSSITPIGGYNNRIVTSSSLGFAANGSSYPRLTALYDRDVQIGDIVFLSNANGSSTQTTSVAGLVPTVIGAVIGSATPDVGNALSQPASNPGSATINASGGSGSTLLTTNNYFLRYSYAGPFGETWASGATSFAATNPNMPRVTVPAVPTGATHVNLYLSPPAGSATACTLYSGSNTISATVFDLAAAYASGGAAYPPTNIQTAGTINDVSISLVNGAAYDGTPRGRITETYTIAVTQASSGGSATTALMTVTSASGTDNQLTPFAPAAFGSPTNIGTNGLAVTWNHASGDFSIGQAWQTTIRQSWISPVPTAGGSFTGPASLTYIAKVTRGGLYSDSIQPQVTITSTTGTDQSGPVTVTAAATNVSVGTKGALLQFSGAGLDLNDLYYIPVTGPTNGAYQTIVLANNLISALQSANDLSLTLYLRKNIEVPAERLSSPPLYNWTAGASTIAVNSGIDAYDSSLTNGGVPVATPVAGGSLYVEYRAWLPELAAMLSQVALPSDVMALFPSTYNVPDSVLPYALWQATQYSNGQTIYFTALANPANYTEWQEVLNMLVGYHNIHDLVPLSNDTYTWSLYQAHVVSRSTEPVNGEWRRVFMCPQVVSQVVISNAANSGNDSPMMATLSDNPSIVGTQYTYLTVTSSNGKFVTNGVQPGDVVRYLFTVDAFGNQTFSTFAVAVVVNEDTLVLTTSPGFPVSVGQQVEVWRNLTPDQVADNMAASVTTIANTDSRFYFVFPDSITDSLGNVVNGCFLAAAFAGYVSGIAPQQGAVNLTMPTFTATPRSTQFFNNAQLNTLATAGFVIASTDPVSGQVYIRTARSTDPTSVTTREEIGIRLVDAAMYLLYDAAAQFFGVSNVTSTALAILDNALKSALQHGISDTMINRIGPMILSGGLTAAPRPHLTLPDVVVVQAAVRLPPPFDDVQLLLALGASTISA
jgi:hypothetical protein